MIVLLIASAVWLAATQRIRTTVTVGRARDQLFAIPHLLILFLKDAFVLVPKLVSITCRIATCPMVVFFVALAGGVVTASGVHATVPIVRATPQLAQSLS